MESVDTMKRNELLKSLQSHKKYKSFTQKEISDKLGNIDNLRKEVKKLEKKRVERKEKKVTSPKITQGASTPYVSAKKVLSTILLNSDTEVILQDYILDYIETHPDMMQKVVSKYLAKEGLYHVFFRLQDPDTLDASTDEIIENITLVKTFVNQEDAEKWIMNHGKDLVDEEEDNWGRPVVLTIIYDDNVGIFCAGEESSHPNLITFRKYPTFAFSEAGYKMLIKECEYVHFTNQTWIHYIK